MTEKHSDIVFRNGTNDDMPFLYEMLFEAFHWESKSNRPSLQSFFENNEFRRLLADWGKQGDVSVVAEVKPEKIGAAWYRFWTNDSHSYGYVASHIPEIGIAVRSDFRSQGVGRLLLRRLKEAAQIQEVKQLSLSVDPNNYARRLYESEGFKKCGATGTSWTMICEL